MRARRRSPRRRTVTIPSWPTPDQITALIQRLAAEMEAAGALQLAYSTLWAVHRALPAVSPVTAKTVLRQRRRLAERIEERATLRLL